MRIVQLVSYRHWKHKLDRSRFLAVDPLNVCRTGVGWEGYDNELSVTQNLLNLYGELPGVVIAYKPNDHFGFCDLKCPTVIQYNEINEPRFVPEIEQAEPSMVVMHHFNEWEQWKERLLQQGVKSTYIPHVASGEYFHDYGLPKSHDVIVVGALKASVYPLRDAFVRAVAILARRGFRCEVVAHPGNELDDASSCKHLEDFGRAVNQARITCFCSSIYRYRLSKYVEVPACGSVVAADMPVAPESMEHMIACEPHEPPEVLAERLEDCLGRDYRLEFLVNEGAQYAAKFTPESYSSSLVDVISAIS